MVRRIVDQLHLPENYPDKIFPLSENKIDTDYNFFIDECMSTRMIYIGPETENIIIKLTH